MNANTEISPSSQSLFIEGMTCAACVGRVERALSALPGVEEARVNLVTEQATVRGTASFEALQQAVEKAGYGIKTSTPSKPIKEEPQDETRALWFAAILTAPLLLLGMAHGAIPFAESANGRMVQLLLATAMVFGPGKKFFSLAWKSLLHRSADMNSLVALGAGSAWLYSSAIVLFPNLVPHGEHGARGHVYFEATGAVLFFVLLGKWLETRARRRLRDAVQGLIALVPSTAWRQKNNDFEEVLVARLRVGDVVRVLPGARIPADGTVLEGHSSVDESLLTGESIPVDKSKGSSVSGGTLNLQGMLRIELTRTGEQTALSQLVRAVEDSQGSRAPIARLADEVSRVFVPIVVALAVVVFAVWAALDPTPIGLATALERFVAVLVISCPCALGLATPAAIAVGTGRGAELGVLVKGGSVLERLSHIDTVLLDKTGTLTQGRPQLQAMKTQANVSETQLLQLAASVEQGSEHPLARAVLEAAKQQQLPLLTNLHTQTFPGEGIEALHENTRLRVGTAAFARITDSTLLAQAAQWAAQGHTPLFVARDELPLGVLSVADALTEQAPTVVQQLRALGLSIGVVSGDRSAVVQHVAAKLGIDRVYAETLPTEKASIVRTLEAQGARVAMVGDGVNDAPALATATVGIALGHGADIAAEAAEVTLLSGALGTLPTAIALARATMRTIRQNLFWAFAYNLVGIPLAAGVFFPWTGWQLSPVFASAAMSLSSVSVLLNSLRLRRFSASV